MDELSSSELEEALRRLQRRRKRQGILTLVLSLAVVFAAGVILFQHYIGLCVVAGESMEPSLRPGDVMLFVRRGNLSYGDIVLMEDGDGGLMVKRVAGLPGDTVMVTPEGQLSRNGQMVIEEHTSYGRQNTSSWIAFPCQIQEGELFYLGDNRARSLDSRIVGPVSNSEVVGVVLCFFRLSP